jgi:hypothetical protein
VTEANRLTPKVFLSHASEGSGPAYSAFRDVVQRETARSGVVEALRRHDHSAIQRSGSTSPNHNGLSFVGATPLTGSVKDFGTWLRPVRMLAMCPARSEIIDHRVETLKTHHARRPSFQCTMSSWPLWDL